jgi:tellurite resistance protein TerC
VDHFPVNIPRKPGALELTYKWARRIAIAIVGFTVLAVGVAMIVLPGPAFVVIPAGLGILALEFAWAKRWLHEAKTRGSGMLRSLRAKK